MRRRAFTARLVVAAGFALVLSPQSARAALGDLTPQGCIQDTGGVACGTTTPGLEGAIAVAASPDGDNVYAASFDGDAIVTFVRGMDGSLTATGCIQETGGTDCLGTGGNAPGLDGASDVAVSPDGESVYVASADGDAVVIFSRALDGTLTAEGCIQNTGGSDCTGVGGTTPGLDAASALAVSPDGNNVYVASLQSDAIVIFDRAEDGSLTPAGCIQQTGGTNCNGSGGTAPGLDGANDVAVSPDGSNVYVASYVGDAIAIFDRAMDGSLTSAGCIEGPDGIECVSLGGTMEGLDGPRAVAVSPDGNNVYVPVQLGDAVLTLDRAGDGTLTPAGCIQNTGGLDCTGTGGTAPGLDGATGVVVSADGKQVYIAAVTSDGVATFDRAPDGTLTASGCIQNTGRVECGSTTAGLDGAVDVMLSPGGANLYVASFNSDAIVIFDRETSTTTTTTTTNTTTTTTTSTTTTLPGTTTTTLPEPTTTTTLVEPTTTTTLVEPTTTTTLVEPTTTTTVVEPTTTTMVEPTTTTVVEPTTTTLVEPTTTTTVVEPTTTTTLVEPTTTTTVVEPTTTTSLEPTTTTTLPLPDCGDVNASGSVTAMDALAILKAAVGGDQCDAYPCVCDVAGGGSILSSDALTALRIAVGLPDTPMCPC